MGVRFGFHCVDVLVLMIAAYPPERHTSLASLRLAETRAMVGTCDSRAWQRAVGTRDPISLLKRRLPHVNRATFKLHEVAARLLADRDPPRTAAFLAEAPGGFLFCARQLWPQCECYAMSRTAAGSIAFSRSDPGILSDLPLAADLLEAAVEDAIVERCGAASTELVTADGGTDIVDLDREEQHSTLLVLAQAATALRLQALGGCFVLKIFEGCTLATRELFETLRLLYDRVMLFKPLSSKACNSERYVVAVGLRSPVAAAVASQRLRSVVTQALVDPPRFVHTLGVEVSDMSHEALDQMATEQQTAIRTLLFCVDRGDMSSLREAARKEAKDIEGLFRRYATALRTPGTA